MPAAWQPEPGWHALSGGTGPATVGVWRTALGGRPVVVKRLAAPRPGDAWELTVPSHAGYWRREADVHVTGLLSHSPGVRAPDAAVDEDDAGVTITREWVEEAAVNGLFAAMALGRFARASLDVGDEPPPWLAVDVLGDRLDRVQRGGGWATLARTTVADVAAHLWERRTPMLAALAALPQVPQHGDPGPANLPGRSGDDVVAIDWGTLGTGPVGADLGYYSLQAREEFEPLLDAYLIGLPEGLATREQVLLGAQVTAVYTALNRAEWALARVTRGEGALVAKYRHPAVAPYLRSLQRQAPHIEALLGW